MRKIKKLLIANRGEIAIRIQNAARELQIKTVSIYSEVDRLALHVLKADEVFALNHNGIEPYLDIKQILEIAKRAQVDAIHPGYGFLSENHSFARQTVENGFIFIGPSYETIAMMGDKLQAKKAAQNSNVPVIPGFEITDPGDPGMEAKAGEIGFPLLIKARAGGGGKGMRIATSYLELEEKIRESIDEAKAAFGDGGVFVEKLITQPRHIEIQVLADAHGSVVHLFERECSIQRRHQKVIEEAPSSLLDDTLRQQMGDAAIRLTKACNYVGAGTLEFMVDQHRRFYFLEMNTRLQVEHPVTELITGIDLVKQQISIAEGISLAFTQADLQMAGHAIELRVYAEDPKNSFLPDAGILRTYRSPKGNGIRVDDGYDEGMEIPVEYDPLLAKLIAYGTTREEAIQRMKRAIEDYKIEGVRNTLDFGTFVMKDIDFCNGDFDTNFISGKLAKIGNDEMDLAESEIAAIAAFEFVDNSKPKKSIPSQQEHNKWRNRLN